MSELILVKRANVILDVPVEQKDEYLAKGFDVINSRGTVIEHTVPSDVNVLKKAYTDHINEIAELKKKLSTGNVTNGVSQADYDSLQEDYDSLMADFNEIAAENENLKAELSMLKGDEEKPAKKKSTKK